MNLLTVHGITSLVQPFQEGTQTLRMDMAPLHKCIDEIWLRRQCQSRLIRLRHKREIHPVSLLMQAVSQIMSIEENPLAFRRSPPDIFR